MNRSEKETLIQALRARLKGLTLIVVARFDGLTVTQITALRRELHGASARVEVVKNSLARRAMADQEIAALTHFLGGQTLLAYAQDPVALAKIMMRATQDENIGIRVVGGMLNAAMLDAAALEMLASLPSLDVLRASLVALIQTPGSRMARVLVEPASGLARQAAAYAAKEV